MGGIGLFYGCLGSILGYGVSLGTMRIGPKDGAGWLRVSLFF